MQYNVFGNTGIHISALGFGAMRLPTIRDKNGTEHVRLEQSTEMLRRAFELGVNYVDTAWFYCGGESEPAVGHALRGGWRDKIILSTKLPVHLVKERADGRRFLERQLERLDTDCIDIYHLHGIGKKSMQETVDRFHLIDDLLRAKDEGLIRHLSFSFHDQPEEMLPIIDRGCFSSVLCQYNLLDRANEAAMAYAKSKGLGVVVMGPVAGGRLCSSSEVLRQAVPDRKMKTPELALRFVLANPNVDCALSGMQTLQMVQENAGTTAGAPLQSEEKTAIDRLSIELKQMAELYCTGCGYCMPCPHDVNIPKCFEFMNYHRIYGLTEAARTFYATIGAEWIPGKNASACIDCGECEQKCPQKIPIPEQLKNTHAALG